MKKVLGILTVVTFVASSAFGATVTFTSNDGVGEDYVLLDEQAVFSVDIALEPSPPGPLSSFDAANILIGSHDGLDMDWGAPLDATVFVYTPEWIAANAFPPTVNHAMMYPQDVFVGGYLSAPSSDPWTVGTLTLGTTGLPIGDYGIVVDGGTDGLSGLYLGAAKDTLMGSATVHVTPEPAALVLLGIGGLAALRRRR